ncbi:MAG: EamA family transporter, partial [Lysobacteraceae bacterium]
ELGAGTLALTALAPLMPLLVPAFAGPLLLVPTGHDVGWLVVLALACTLFPFALCLVALRHLSAFTAQLSVNLEPIYAIVLAAIIFGEQQELSARFYLGVAIILGVVFAQGLLAGRRQPAHAGQVGVSEAHHVAD